MIFTTCIRVKGDLQSSFVFENDDEANVWIELDFKINLKKKYEFLTYKKDRLPGFKIGDKCNVFGEGTDAFTIIGIVEYSDHRFGFKLDNGLTEEVAKCHADFLKENDE